MEPEFKKLNEKDHKKAIEFAIKGMHFDRYTSSNTLLHLYGKYFWYDELLHSSRILTLYYGDELAGVLLANINDEEKAYKSFSKALYVKAFELMQKLFNKDGAGKYENANAEMLERYKSKNNPDGQIVFLAANPDINVKGIGTKLLKEFEKAENRKEIFLFTDDQCTYQFYEHRGFIRSCEKDILFTLKEKSLTLKCLLYSKKIDSCDGR